MKRVIFILQLFTCLFLPYSVFSQNIGKIESMLTEEGKLINKVGCGYIYRKTEKGEKEIDASPGDLLILKDIFGTRICEADIVIWNKNSKETVFGIGEKTEFSLNSTKLIWLLLGNLNVFSKGDVEIKTAFGQINSLKTKYYVNVTNDGMAVTVVEGAILIKNRYGSQIVTEGEWGCIFGNQPPKKGKNFQAIESSIINDFELWENRIQNIMDRNLRGASLFRISRFVNLNTGFNTADIREPGIELIKSSIPGKGIINIVIKPPN